VSGQHVQTEPFAPTFESLWQYQVPEWFRDAKFGIWSHWGAQSVAMYGDWYARHLYVEGSPQYLYHLRHYGHPSRFGYKDLVKTWKAEQFDPDSLMDLYQKAGARYFMGQAMHHDHFFNFPSQYNRFNSVNVGPGKDICGLWKAAAQNQHLPFGFSEHLGATYSWWRTNKGCDQYGPYAGVPYDGNDPEYRDFYLDNYEHVNPEGSRNDHAPWYSLNPKWHQYWLDVINEVIDRYQPDLLYSDGPLPFGKHQESLPGDPAFDEGLKAVARLYNTSIDIHGSNEAVYLQKDRRSEIYRVGILDIEKSQLPDIRQDVWHTDTCIGNWFYDVRQTYKKPGHIIEMLIDIIAKNGNMLLNILQKPDGSIDDEAHWILDELASWFSICAEGVHGTRPWRVSGEGTSKVLIDGFKEVPVDWNASDVRFTSKGSTVYAFLLRSSERHVAILQSFTATDLVRQVRLLGVGAVPFTQSYGVLTVQLPLSMPSQYANCLAIELAQ